VGGAPRVAAGRRAAGPAASHRAWALALASVACGALTAYGFWRRDELELSPREGAGYALGIVGLACMAALLLYSVRKRAHALRSAGALRHWFQAHMVLGIAGPVAILFHAGFSAESVNGGVALGAMLLVAGSGIVGRFLYTGVHAELFGRRESLREVSERADASGRALREALARAPGVLPRLQEIESCVLDGSGSGLGPLLVLAPRVRRAERAARSALSAARADARLEGALREHLALLRRAASFAFYERLLSLWHAIHLPLCVILFAAAALHVFAVHRF
jgi:hypothetical protein